MRHPARPALLALLAACAGAPPVGSGLTSQPPALGAPVLVPQESNTGVLLQAVSAVNEQVAWASGRAGTYLRTVDGGATWEVGRVAGADSLEFRDVEAVNERTAYLLSAGPGDQSRIYKTEDGGQVWVLQHRNTEPEGFYDCFDFWTPERGIVFSDAVRGEHLVLVTGDGGATWERIPPGRLPPALPGEGSFASSGTCVAASGTGTALVGLGNTAATRVMRTEDGGGSWTVAEAPVIAGEGAGIGSVVRLGGTTAVAVGGHFGGAPARGTRVALSGDAGGTWTAGGEPTIAGALYGAARVPGTDGAVVAVGPGGADLSRDGGRTWARLDTLAWWSIDIASPRAGWMVGPAGRIVRLEFRPAP